MPKLRRTNSICNNESYICIPQVLPAVSDDYDDDEIMRQKSQKETKIKEDSILEVGVHFINFCPKLEVLILQQVNFFIFLIINI